jgi:FkbM family methyltransferase
MKLTPEDEKLYASAVNGRDAETLANLGIAYFRRMKVDEALACTEAALAIKPDFPAAQFNRDQLLGHQKFFGEVRATIVEHARRTGLDPSTIESTDIEFPAAFVDASGDPRFKLAIPGSLILSDLGAAILFQHEVAGRGWEFPLRNFLDAQLRSDDVFIDVGAHWGIHSLTAATTRLSNQVSVLAIEAHPENAERLRGWVARNRLREVVEVVSTAVGDREGTAQLRLNASSMGHSLERHTGNAGAPEMSIAVTTLDNLMALRPSLQWRRVLLKIDVEGHEYEVLAGARSLFASGNVAAVIWENSEHVEREIVTERRTATLAFLNSFGFAHYHFDYEKACLVPLSTPDLVCDVYSLVCDVYSLSPNPCAV